MKPKEQATPWTATIRRESGLLEHVCKHGVGHPVYASVDFIQRTRGADLSVHGCCGCCGTEEWKRESYRQSIRIANAIIVKLHQQLREAPGGRDLGVLRHACLAEKYATRTCNQAAQEQTLEDVRKERDENKCGWDRASLVALELEQKLKLAQDRICELEAIINQQSRP